MNEKQRLVDEAVHRQQIQDGLPISPGMILGSEAPFPTSDTETAGDARRSKPVCNAVRTSEVPAGIDQYLRQIDICQHEVGSHLFVD